MADEMERGMHRERISFLYTSISMNNNSLSDGFNGVPNGLQCNKVFIERDTFLINKINNTETRRLPKLYKWRDLLFSIFSTALFLADIVSDILLALQYYRQSETLLFQLTISFIFIPSLFSFIINCVWNYMVYVEDLEKEEQECKISKKLLFFRVFTSLIQLGRLFRNMEYMYYMVLSWKLKGTDKEIKMRLRAMEEKRDACILGLIDGFMESAMQLLLQLYLSFYHRLPATFLRVVTLSLSLACTSWIHTAYYRHNRNSDVKKEKMGLRLAMVYWLCVLAELSPRFLLLAAFGAYFMPWCFILPVAHFALFMAFHCYTNPELYGMCCCKAGKFLFLILCSYINIFCYINVTGGRTFYKRLLYYIFFYTENVIMVSLVWYKTNGDKHIMFTMLTMPVGFLFHVLFLFLYYKLFHPNNRADL